MSFTHLKISGTYNTPEINFDPVAGLLVISGRSIPEHAILFYKQLDEWLDQYIRSDPPDTVIEMRLEYLNSASHKHLLNILEKLEVLNQGETNVKAKWLYEDDDEEMYDSGVEYSESVDIPFELISVEEF